MEDSIANAMGQGPSMTILGADGKEYALAPLRMKDMGGIEQFCKARHRKDGLDLIREAGDLLTTKEREQMIRELSREVSGRVSGEDSEPEWTWMQEMSSPAVIEYVIVMRLTRANSELTQLQASDLVTVEAIANVKEEFTSLLGLDAFPGGGDEGPGEAGSG